MVDDDPDEERTEERTDFEPKPWGERQRCLPRHTFRIHPRTAERVPLILEVPTEILHWHEPEPGDEPSRPTPTLLTRPVVIRTQLTRTIAMVCGALVGALLGVLI